MNRSSLTCLLLLSLLASAHSVSATDDDDARQAAFYERLKLQKNTFDQFCFLSGPEIQGDTQMKAMAAQMLATDFSFLGRHNDALQTFPNRGSGPPRTDLPTTPCPLRTGSARRPETIGSYWSTKPTMPRKPGC